MENNENKEKFVLLEEVAKYLGLEQYDEEEIINYSVSIEDFQNIFVDATKNHDLYMRALAECDNVRKQCNIKIAKANTYKYEALFKDIIDVLDNFDKALANEEKTDGINIIYNMLIKILNDNGLSEYTINQGDVFDTNTMNAIAIINVPNAENNTVVDVVKKAYKYNDYIIRYADVVVNKIATE